MNVFSKTIAVLLITATLGVGIFVPHETSAQISSVIKCSGSLLGLDEALNFVIGNIEEGINAVRTRFNTLWIDEEKCAVLLNSLGHNP